MVRSTQITTTVRHMSGISTGLVALTDCTSRTEKVPTEGRPQAHGALSDSAASATVQSRGSPLPAHLSLYPRARGRARPPAGTHTGTAARHAPTEQRRSRGDGLAPRQEARPAPILPGRPPISPHRGAGGRPGRPVQRSPCRHFPRLRRAGGDGRPLPTRPEPLGSRPPFTSSPPPLLSSVPFPTLAMFPLRCPPREISAADAPRPLLTAQRRCRPSPFLAAPARSGRVWPGPAAPARFVRGRVHRLLPPRPPRGSGGRAPSFAWQDPPPPVAPRWPLASAACTPPSLSFGPGDTACPGAAGPGGGRRVRLDRSEQAERRPKLMPRSPSCLRPAALLPAAQRLRATVTGLTDGGAAKLLAVVPGVSFQFPGYLSGSTGWFTSPDPAVADWRFVPGGSSLCRDMPRRAAGCSREGQRGLRSCPEGPPALRADPAAAMLSVSHRYSVSDVREKLALAVLQLPVAWGRTASSSCWVSLAKKIHQAASSLRTARLPHLALSCL
ncbi:PREDICTED: translation initiation factor IF-2-like [Sturnus vulgaris]|uniref:translation initiation factor IF-2-like n=1 Tax=Sturnus vulgaris TaxID=9172 RepID=UPI00071A43F3|nr:PREDICTED: translation initiation factor IF-2-like [Sturnus vulgaris]